MASTAGCFGYCVLPHMQSAIICTAVPKTASIPTHPAAGNEVAVVRHMVRQARRELAREEAEQVGCVAAAWVLARGRSARRGQLHDTSVDSPPTLSQARIEHERQEEARLRREQQQREKAERERADRERAEK